MNQASKENVETFHPSKTRHSDVIHNECDSHYDAKLSHTSRKEVHFISPSEMTNLGQCTWRSALSQQTVTEKSTTASTAFEAMPDEPKASASDTSMASETSRLNSNGKIVDVCFEGSSVKRGIRRTPTPHPNDMRKSLARRLAALQSESEEPAQECEHFNDTIVNSPANGTDSGNDESENDFSNSISGAGQSTESVVKDANIVKHNP